MGRQKAKITQINPLRYYMIKSCNLTFTISLILKKALKNNKKTQKEVHHHFESVSLCV